jgi:acyl-CoA reductase-like NAD-dependent aldehyde dehydrogenase
MQAASPGNLDDLLPPVEPGDVPTALAAAAGCFRDWARRPLEERIAALRAAQESLREHAEELALGMAREMGKPLTEARGEVGAVIAKFDLTIEDALAHLPEKTVNGGPHPAAVRQCPRGPAAVIAPFNFPLHLGHGATVAYLLAGNPVLLKPSPFAPRVALRYGELFSRHLPEGVLQVVPGGRDEAVALATDPRVRAVCFTGSAAAGRELARLLAEDFSKSLALELGGKNSAVIFADANLSAAAEAVAQGLCLTTGQRCNATNRVLIHRSVREEFLERLAVALAPWQPGSPLEESTKLGPLVSEAAVARFLRLAKTSGGTAWLAPTNPGCVDALRGFYVTPGVLLFSSPAEFLASPLAREEPFSPLLSVESFVEAEEAWAAANAVEQGLTAAVWTRTEATWQAALRELQVGNLYRNLPTTFSPSTLPFPGWKLSGNGHPGGRGFVRSTTEEQAVQWLAEGGQ